MQWADAIRGHPVFDRLRQRLGQTSPPLAVSGLWGSCAPIVAALLADSLNRPLLCVTAHLEQADDTADDIQTLTGRAPDLLPSIDTLIGEAAREVAADRARLCARLLHDSPREGAPPVLLVAPIQSLIAPVPARRRLDENTLILRVGETQDLAALAARFVERGFERLDQVEQPGDFAIRGGILDVFYSPDVDPVRVEFFGDQIESVRRFDAVTQRSRDTQDEIRIVLPPRDLRDDPSDTAHFFEYLPPDTLITFAEPVEIQEIGRLVLDRLGNPVGHYPADAVFRGAGRFAQVHLSRFAGATTASDDAFAFRCAALPPFEAKATDAVRQLLDLARERRTIVYCDNEGESERLAELIDQVILDDARDPASRSAVERRIGLLHHGFLWNEQPSPLAVVPHHELLRRYTQQRRMRKVTTGRPIESFLDLQEGDYVVHILHGIARYVGMRTMRKADSRKSEEYLTLRFADDDVMHVPASQIDLVQKYIGARGARPTLSKLGGQRWQTTKQKVEEALTDLASDLLRIQAVRESQEGIAYPQDTHWQREFEAAFLYTPTPDQVTALSEIKRDMTRPRPMDRLLCGDVGYGKTELAVRAAFKVVEYGKQAAVLVPTTVLAEQHFRTFRERMADYPFRIECLNRFRSAAEQKRILAAARAGQVDILIGTHRLLSRDVQFADLGLVVVDEEQRFGVEHKERLKRLRATVDVLTLTATPIPRTLHMAMIGVRDISSLGTPPMDRRAIATSVCAWNDELIREAIVRELNRDGQVFFVHNRVQSIQAVAAKLAGLVPSARLLIGHGQMHGDALEDVMLKFVRREADVLVCTSIIEAGLDIPTANTIFIDRADQFGLADLHQLRGRVGRYKHHAYCYLLLSPHRPMTPTAARRLKAVEQFSELGAGFRIAMRDLEIRGAGNILGPEQSGNIAAVGYELYCQLLEHTVKRMRGEVIAPRVSVHLEMDLEAYIPRSYIASDRQRMECYRRFAACHTAQDVEQLARDLADAFGKPPETVDVMLSLAEIRVRAAMWNIRKIIRRPPDVIFHIEGEIKRIEPLFVGSQGTVQVPDGRTLHWRPPDNYFHGDSLLRILRNMFVRAESAQPADRRQAAAC